MDTLLMLVGLAIFFTFIFGGEKLLALYRVKQQMRHIENVIATLPEDERVKFAKNYLKDRVSQLKQTENPYLDADTETEIKH